MVIPMTQPLPLSSITISPERQRREFDPEALTDLANSISAHGLLHAIVVRETPNGVTLVAGERRLRAMETIWMVGGSIRHNGQSYPPETVPAVTLGELDPIAAEEAELDENLRREDLTWQEEAAAIKRLHDLRTKQAQLLGQTHSVADTAREVYSESAAVKSGGSLGEVHQQTRNAIILADHLDNPDVAKAKNSKEAFKVLKKQEETRKNVELAERIGKSFNSSAHTLLHEDCLEWLAVCPANSFDVILTDPPYGMGADAFGDGAGRLVNSEHHYKDDVGSWRSLMQRVVPEFFRIAKPQAHAYIFCDFDRFHELKGMMQDAGWKVFRTPIINYKPNSGRVPLPEHGPRRQYELCLYAIKGNKPVTAIYSDVIQTTLEENLTHGAQKPIELYVNLLRRSCRPGDLVIDPFAGSGTIFPAAHSMKVRATGIEKNPEYFGIAVSRLNALDDEPAFC